MTIDIVIVQPMKCFFDPTDFNPTGSHVCHVGLLENAMFLALFPQGARKKTRSWQSKVVRLISCFV